MEHSQPGDAEDLFEEALKIDENNAQALYGLALSRPTVFAGDAAGIG